MPHYAHMLGAEGSDLSDMLGRETRTRIPGRNHKSLFQLELHHAVWIWKWDLDCQDAKESVTPVLDYLLRKIISELSWLCGILSSSRSLDLISLDPQTGDEGCIHAI